MISLLIISVCLLAWSNGANDMFKGVASLYGSGATNYRTALARPHRLGVLALPREVKPDAVVHTAAQ